MPGKGDVLRVLADEGAAGGSVSLLCEEVVRVAAMSGASESSQDGTCRVRIKAPSFKHMGTSPYDDKSPSEEEEHSNSIEKRCKCECEVDSDVSSPSKTEKMIEKRATEQVKENNVSPNFEEKTVRPKGCPRSRL